MRVNYKNKGHKGATISLALSKYCQFDKDTHYLYVNKNKIGFMLSNIILLQDNKGTWVK